MNKISDNGNHRKEQQAKDGVVAKDNPLGLVGFISQPSPALAFAIEVQKRATHTQPNSMN